MKKYWKPVWSSPIKIENGGRYPLGLNRFHDGMEEILIKSVTVMASRLRYITYCCWAIGDISINETCNDYAKFVEAFRYRENALAIGLYLLAPSYSYYGNLALAKVVEPSLSEHDCSFNLMQSNKLGAFGLYYLGTTYNLGLIERTQKGLVLSEKGKELYDIAEEYFSLVKPSYYLNFRGVRMVTTNTLKEWALVNDFDNIKQPTFKKEREFFQSLIFRLEKKEVADYRRLTFAYSLECIDRCANTNTSFNEDVLRNINYYRQYYDDSRKLLDFEVPDHFKDVHFYWFIYEGHVYFRWWLDNYFATFLSYLKGCSNGATLEEFYAQVNQEEFNETLGHFGLLNADYYHCRFRDIIKHFNSTSALDSSASEETVKKNEGNYKSITGTMAMLILTVLNLYSRFKTLRYNRRYQYVSSSLRYDLWFESLFQETSLEELTVEQVLKLIMKRYVIEQHDLIMMEKNDIRKCWFTTENKRYFYQSDTSAIWRPAKYETIMSFLKDMNLIEVDNGFVRLSMEGQTFYSKLKSGYLI